MSDGELPHDAELPDELAGADEPVGGDDGLVITPGGPDAAEADEDEPSAVPEAVEDSEPSAESDLVEEAAPEDEVPESEPEPEVEAAEAAAPEQAPATAETQFTLDELVAEMAGVSAVTSEAGTGAEPVVPQRVDPLTAAMSEAFEEVPVESELWTRLPFWILGAAWALFTGVITYLLWPVAKSGLTGTQLYGVLVYGGVALVVVGAVAGVVVWSRARTRCAMPDRGVVSRAILLRAVGWTATGVAVWVVSMIVLSLHSLDVIP